MATYTTNIFTGGTASGDSIFGAGYEADKAVDGNTATFWNSATHAFPFWWKYDLGIGNEQVISKLRVYPYKDGFGSYIKNINFYGSNDDASYTLIASGTVADLSAFSDFVFFNVTTYRYYKLEILDSYRGDAPYGVLVEIEGLVLTSGGLDSSETKSLLHFNGTNASTVFEDESGKIWTANGNAQLSTTGQKFGSACGLFDGSGDYLSSPANPDFAFHTGDFTIDCWVNVAAFGDSFIFSSAINGELFFGFRGYNDIGIGRAGVAWDNVWLHGFTTGSLVHIAITRSGTDLRMFVNGSQVGSTQTDTRDWQFDNTAYIGSQGTNFYFNGRMDELRISKGVARWTANFTPPTSEYVPVTPTPPTPSVFSGAFFGLF